MTIPHWVDKGKRSKSEKATARLKYLMSTLAARHTSRSSMRGLADMIDMSHSTLSLYIRRGAFTDSAAKHIVESLKDGELTAEMLMDPMSISKSPG